MRFVAVFYKSLKMECTYLDAVVEAVLYFSPSSYLISLSIFLHIAFPGIFNLKISH